MMAFVKVLKECMYVGNFGDSWSNDWAFLKLNNLMGKVKTEFIEAERTIITSLYKRLLMQLIY